MLENTEGGIKINNVNKTYNLPQTTGGKDEPKHFFLIPL